MLLKGKSELSLLPFIFCHSLKSKIMKKSFLLFSIIISSLALHAQIVINELDGSADRVEIKNLGLDPVNVSTYILCTWPQYNSLGSLNLESGNLVLAGGELLVVTGHPFNENDGELGLYINSSFSSASSIVDYVEWGSTGHVRSSVAVNANIWTTSDFVAAPPSGTSLMYDGSGNTSAHWFNGTPTFGSENNSCVLVGDFNETLEVNAADLLMFLAEYGCDSDCGIFDLNEDMVVNTGDLLIFVTVYGSTC